MPTRHPAAARTRLAAGLVAVILMAVASPALAGSLLDQTRDALQQAGKDIGWLRMPAATSRISWSTIPTSIAISSISATGSACPASTQHVGRISEA